MELPPESPVTRAAPIPLSALLPLVCSIAGGLVGAIYSATVYLVVEVPSESATDAPRLFPGAAAFIGAGIGVVFGATCALGAFAAFRATRSKISGLPLYIVTGLGGAIVMGLWSIKYLSVSGISGLSIVSNIAFALAAACTTGGLTALRDRRARAHDRANSAP